MKLLSTLTTCLLAVSLLGCVASSGGVKKPSETLDVQNAEAFKKNKKVAIGSFKISFVTFDKSSSKSTSSMASSDSTFAKTTLRAKLEGVDDATFQKLTDFAYQDFVSKLRAQGYEVVDRKVLTRAASYASLPTSKNPKKQTSSFKSVTGGSREETTFAPTSLPLYHEEYLGTPAKTVPREMYAVSEEAGVATLNAHYKIHFAWFDKEANESGNTKTAKVTLGQSVRSEHGSEIVLSAGHAGTFSNPNGYITLTWGVSSDSPYGTTSDGTSGSQEAANTFSSIVGMFSGSSMSAREYVITAEPDKYSAAARDVIGRTTDKFVGKITSFD